MCTQPVTSQTELNWCLKVAPLQSLAVATALVLNHLNVTAEKR